MATYSSPTLSIKEIGDIYSRTNFQALSSYFAANNQLLGFQFFEIVLTAATTNYAIAHNLGYVPQDIVVTHCSGAGVVTLNWGAFTSKQMSITTTGACRLRLFVGSYWNLVGSANSASSDTQIINPSASSPTPTTSSTTTTSSSYTKPTAQKFLATGSTTGWLFTISTSTTCAVGDTYTNNGNTYTVLSALSSQSGQVLFTSGSNAPSASGTLTRGSGSGTASVTFTAAAALATYTRPTSPTPIYLRITMVGGGGGGGGSGTAAGSAGSAGGNSTFGTTLLVANGGGAGSGGGFANFAGGTGGTASLGTGPIGSAFQGQNGAGNEAQGASPPGNINGSAGGNTPLGGTNGTAAVTNTGGGGGGGGLGIVATGSSGSGGGAGGFVEAIITSPASTYVYAVGAAGTAQAAGTSGAAGGAGPAGQTIIEEFYQ
jgi:hypothetical protein